MFRSNNVAARVFERQITTPAPGTSVSFAFTFFFSVLPICYGFIVYPVNLSAFVLFILNSDDVFGQHRFICLNETSLMQLYWKCVIRNQEKFMTVFQMILVYVFWKS